MKKKEESQRFVLALFFSAVVFVTLLVSLLVTGLLVYVLNREGIFAPAGTTELGSGRLIALMMGISLVLGTTVTYALIRIPLSPINSVLDGMRRLSRGDYGARVNMGRFMGRHQVGEELVDTFNTLASELENTEMLRSDFVNNFSHEFKTPIVSIAGFAKLLNRGNLSEAQKKEYLEIIEKESLRLANMATNVLNLTKLENQSILTELSEYNLSEQIRNCVLMLENQWTKKNTQLDLEFQEHMVFAEEELLKQVWINLIGNAIKFSPEGGRLDISIEESEENICVSVSNEGEPIPEGIRSKIFKKFYQADESHATEGNGIGLAVVKRIVDMHKGSVSVQSEGGFNTFTVCLPKVCWEETE